MHRATAVSSISFNIYKKVLLNNRFVYDMDHNQLRQGIQKKSVKRPKQYSFDWFVKKWVCNRKKWWIMRCVTCVAYHKKFITPFEHQQFHCLSIFTQCMYNLTTSTVYFLFRYRMLYTLPMNVCILILYI